MYTIPERCVSARGKVAAGMTSSLKRAIEREEWVVVTGWSPHWRFGRWDLR
ncbi:hypothetical protein DRB17_18120 [Ferruginivarius sediminum]|uniref:ABC-type glycine betaine transport system substrate-binding domain-containing protein n=1 Tax=Ferruginivarius sediminum TaxID=2661937 RepID=A0A369T7I6_9PROT|nr:hypothetical protein DRB17_18120 [Ferruginivarius sediminum]